MRKAAITLATVAALGAAAIAAPAPAEARGLGPALGFGLAAGVIGAGLAASTWPGYAYGPGYGYYGPPLLSPGLLRRPLRLLRRTALLSPPLLAPPLVTKENPGPWSGVFRTTCIRSPDGAQRNPGT